jgi:hypothetical protein
MIPIPALESLPSSSDEKTLKDLSVKGERRWGTQNPKVPHFFL